MAKFKYRAMNTEEEKFEGVKEADSKQEVINYIAANGYYPLLVEEVSESKEVKLNFNSKVRTRDISIFCRQFYTMLDSGVPILTSLNILGNQTENKILQEAIIGVERDVERGEVLSTSMSKYKRAFPDLLVNLIEAGEASGNLNSIMLRMATHFEKDTKTRNKVRNAMIYPLILSIVAVIAVIFILVYVMPTFKEIFEQTRTTLPWYTSLVIGSGDFLKDNFILLFILIFTGISSIKYYFKTESGKLFKSKLQFKVPGIKKLNEMIIVSRFTRTLSTLIYSGMPLIKALNIVSGVIENKIAQKSLAMVQEKVVRGESLNDSMRQTELFPEMLYSMIKIGEDTGSLDEILNKTADFYDEELDSTIQATVSLMEPVLIVVMGFIIGFIVISVMMPMYDSYNQIG